MMDNQCVVMVKASVFFHLNCFFTPSVFLRTLSLG